MRRLWRDERGISYALTALLFAFVVLPLMLLSMQLGRMVSTKHALQNAADAAAEAAVAMVDVGHFRATGDIVLSSDVYPTAQYYAQRTFAHLGAKGVTPRVTGIWVDEATNTVRVAVEARVSALFGVPVTVHAQGAARVRAFYR